jgi:hypothetical protein
MSPTSRALFEVLSKFFVTKGSTEGVDCAWIRLRIGSIEARKRMWCMSIQVSDQYILKLAWGARVWVRDTRTPP